MLGFSSVFNFTNFALPVFAAATFSTTGAEHAARPAPRRPKIDQHRLAALQHLVLKTSSA